MCGGILIDLTPISTFRENDPIVLDDDAADGYVSIASREVGLVQGSQHKRFQVEVRQVHASVDNT